jgi:hypothetical protein
MWSVAVVSTEQEGWAACAAEQERHAETTARLELMTREARLSRESTEKAVRRLERLRDGVAHLHDIYAVAPNEPRCCSDCAANDISPQLRRLLADTADPSERIPLARLKESNPKRWRDMCECGHTAYDHSASNVTGCYHCECGVDA